MSHEPHMSSAIPAAAIAELERGHLIGAIKLVRLETGLGLKESKELVEAYLAKRPDLQRKAQAAQAEARDGLVRWLVIFLAVAAAAAYFLTQGK